MAVTRIKNNQIFDKTVTYHKIADQTLVGSLFNPNLTLASNITITGNLSVLGDSTTINSTNTFVNDPIIVFNNGYQGSPTYDVGILVNRNLNGGNTAWVWHEASQAFEAIYTTETGGTVGTINNSGFASVKTGNLVAVTSATVASIGLSGSTIATTGNVNLNLAPTGAAVTFAADALPTADSTFTVGASGLNFKNVFTATATVGGAVLTTSGGDFTITPPPGGNTVIANVSIAGSGSTFTGNVVSGNVTITGGTINNTTVGATGAAAGTFTTMTTGNAQVTGGAITGTPVSGSTVGATVLTTANAQVSGGAITNTPVSGSTVQATVLTTANAQISGGAITNTPVSGAAGSFTTLSSSALATLASATITGTANVTDTTQSTTSTNGAFTVAGGVGVAKNLNVGGNLAVSGSTTLGNIVVAGDSISAGNVTISATGTVKVGALTMPQVDGATGAVMVTDGAGVLSLQPFGAAVTGNVITLGTPTTGTLVDNSPAIVTFTTGTMVTDAVDKLNEILGKLVPPQPPVFPNATTLAVQSLSSGLRMTNFTQTDNTASGGHNLSGGSTVSAYRRAAAFTTNVINDVGPGSSGNVQVVKNGTVSGSHVMVESFAAANNGTYGELVISDNADYSTKFSPARALLFWTSFDAQASGTVAAGWNEVAMTDTAGSATNTAVWYYDASAPGTPVVASSTFAPTTEVTAYSASVPHYSSTTVWTGTGTATKLSGDLYPASDTFLTGSAGGSFQAPASVTYAAAGVTTPLVRNFPGSASFSTTVNTVNATGSSSTGPSYSVANSYATGSGTATPGGQVLTIKANDTAVVDENYIVVGAFGTGGSATAVRVGGLATGAAPTTGSVAAWSSSAALAAYEATVVAGIAKNDTTNYSTGYFPVGPDLSTGRSGTQYITFRITKDATSKFDIKFSGKVSGCKVAMPGSSLDTTAAPTNGWIDPAVSYGGSGVPGTGTGGNGSAGCGLGGTMTTGATVTNLSTTVTFGTESSHNSTGNYIYVRFALAAGDSITALSFPVATH